MALQALPSGTPARGRMSCDCSSSHMFCFLLFITVRVDPILYIVYSGLPNTRTCALILLLMFFLPTCLFIKRKPRYGCSCIIIQRNYHAFSTTVSTRQPIRKTQFCINICLKTSFKFIPVNTVAFNVITYLNRVCMLYIGR